MNVEYRKYRFPWVQAIITRKDRDKANNTCVGTGNNNRKN